MATQTKKYQIQTIDENTKEVLEILHIETEADIVSYIDTEPVLQAIGGVPVGKTYPNGSVQQVLYDILHPYIKPAISISASPNGGVIEKGTVLDTINITINVTKKSSPITKVEVLKGSTVIYSDTTLKDTGNLIFNYAANLSADSTIKATVTDEQGSVVTSNAIGYTFVYPLYIGSLDSSISTPTAAQITAMDKKVVSKSNQTYNYTIDSKRMCIACPPGWTLSKIIDPNGFDVTASFNVQSLSITGLDGTAQTYTIYISDITTQTDFNMAFNI